MAEESEWTVASDASDEERISSLGSEGLGAPRAPKRAKTLAEPGDLELAELYRRVARDGYIELQCIQEKVTSSLSGGLEERNNASTIANATNDFRLNQLLDKTKEDKTTPHDSTFDFCEDMDVELTPQVVQKSVIRGAKKRKARTVGMWNNVIRHLQIDYTTDKTEDETVQDKVENCSLQEGSMKSSEEQSTVAESGYHLPLSLSTINR
jgi:hypothetical protein